MEMEIPKTLWLKNHMKPEDFEKSYFFEYVLVGLLSLSSVSGS